MMTDGGGYTFLKVDNGLQSNRVSDPTSCADYGMQLAIPRTKAHLQAMIDVYGRSYWNIAPVSKATGGSTGGPYTNIDFSWTSDSSDKINNWQAIDGGSWWMSDSNHGEPNGDYSANCWLKFEPNDALVPALNDANCGYSTTNYLCSPNDKDPAFEGNNGNNVVVDVPSKGFALTGF